MFPLLFKQEKNKRIGDEFSSFPLALAHVGVLQDDLLYEVLITNSCIGSNKKSGNF
jgi:hypothetical protein